MTVETPGGVKTLPVDIIAVPESAHLAHGGHNPLQRNASTHEVTFGVVCRDDEMDTVMLIAREHSAQAERNGRRVTPLQVAKTLDRLLGICGSAAAQDAVFHWNGALLCECYGEEAARAAVHAVRAQSVRISREQTGQEPG